MPRSTWSQWRSGLARLMGVDLTHAQERYFACLERAVRPGVCWVDLGCGRQIVPEWAAALERQREVAGRARELIGVDVSDAIHDHQLLHAKVVACGEQLPFRDGSVDLVTLNMVAEHIRGPAPLLSELRRVLSPTGRLIIHTPNRRCPYVAVARLIPEALRTRIVYYLEGRVESDVFPTYYALNTPEEIRRRAADAGLVVETLEINSSVGSLGAMGLLGLLELLVLKLLSLAPLRRYQVVLLTTLRRSGERG